MGKKRASKQVNKIFIIDEVRLIRFIADFVNYHEYDELIYSPSQTLIYIIASGMIFFDELDSKQSPWLPMPDQSRNG